MKKGERLGAFLRLYSLVVSSLLRNARECSLPELLILLELEGAGELSTLALVRRLEERGVKNARMTILRAEAMQLIDCEQREDGKWWRMSAEGRAVLERALRKIWRGRS